MLTMIITGWVLAESFASGSSSVHSWPRCEIAPLSATLALGGNPTDQKAVVETGQFAIIVIDDCYDAQDQDWVVSMLKPSEEKESGIDESKYPKKNARYAFVAPRIGEEGYDIMDVSQFLEKVCHDLYPSLSASACRLASFHTRNHRVDPEFHRLLRSILVPSSIWTLRRSLR